MSNLVNLGSSLGNISSNNLESQRGSLEKEILSLAKNIDTHVHLINKLKSNIVNLKKGKVVVSLNEYRKILSELLYLNNNLVVLKDVHKKNESHLKSIKKVYKEKEGKLIKLPIKKAKRRRVSKKNKV